MAAAAVVRGCFRARICHVLGGPILGPSADGSQPTATTTAPGNARDLALRRLFFARRASSLGRPKPCRVATAEPLRDPRAKAAGRAPLTHLHCAAEKPGRFTPAASRCCDRQPLLSGPAGRAHCSPHCAPKADQMMTPNRYVVFFFFFYTGRRRKLS